MGRRISPDPETQAYVAMLLSDPCSYCGTTSRPRTIDHIEPYDRDGAPTWENLTAACRPCNSRKHTKALLPFVAECVGAQPIARQRALRRRMEKPTLTHIPMESALLKALDEYRWQHRFPSRSATLRWLVMAAMDAGATPTPEQIIAIEQGVPPWS